MLRMSNEKIWIGSILENASFWGFFIINTKKSIFRSKILRKRFHRTFTNVIWISNPFALRSISAPVPNPSNNSIIRPPLIPNFVRAFLIKFPLRRFLRTLGCHCCVCEKPVRRAREEEERKEIKSAGSQAEKAEKREAHTREKKTLRHFQYNRMCLSMCTIFRQRPVYVRWYNI